MPGDAFRWSVLRTLAASTLGAFAWDRACLAVFAPHVLRAALAASRPDPRAALAQLRRTAAYVLTAVALAAVSFNPLALYLVYRLYKGGFYN